MPFQIPRMFFFILSFPIYPEASFVFGLTFSPTPVKIHYEGSPNFGWISQDCVLLDMEIGQRNFGLSTTNIHRPISVSKSTPRRRDLDGPSASTSSCLVHTLLYSVVWLLHFFHLWLVKYVDLDHKGRLHQEKVNGRFGLQSCNIEIFKCCVYFIVSTLLRAAVTLNPIQLNAFWSNSSLR